MIAEARRVLRDEINARRRGLLAAKPKPPTIPPKPTCIYCGGRTAYGLSTCRGHSDLPDLDPDLQARKELAA